MDPLFCYANRAARYRELLAALPGNTDVPKLSPKAPPNHGGPVEDRRAHAVDTALLLTGARRTAFLAKIVPLLGTCSSWQGMVCSQANTFATL